MMEVIAQCVLSFLTQRPQRSQGDQTLKLSLDGDDFTTIKIKIYLTRQPPIMVSVLLPKLGYHLPICSLG
jgi:hypothetical protein